MNAGGIVRLKTPLTEREVRGLRAGDFVSLTGDVVTARDKVYAKTLDYARAKRHLPLDLTGAVVYHCGPLVRRTSGGWKVLSAGPTTSARLDDVQAEFVRRTGVRGLIGKGGVGAQVAEELSRLGCVYFAFPGGAGALAARSIKSVKHVYWKELGLAEALWVLRVEDFGPLVVAVDAHGKNLYRQMLQSRQRSR